MKDSFLDLFWRWYTRKAKRKQLSRNMRKKMKRIINNSVLSLEAMHVLVAGKRLTQKPLIYKRRRLTLSVQMQSAPDDEAISFRETIDVSRYSHW